MYGKKWGKERRRRRRLEPPTAVEPGNDRAYSDSPPRDGSVGRDRQGNRGRHPRKSEIVFHYYARYWRGTSSPIFRGRLLKWSMICASPKKRTINNCFLD